MSPVDDLNKQVADLSPAKRALLQRKRKQPGSHETAAPTIHPRDRGENAPMSFAQQRLWLIHQLDPQSYLYNVPRVVRLKGKLNLDALEQSLNEIVRRHEVLRTTFIAESDHPVQRIAQELRIALPLIEVEGLNEKRRDEEVQRLALEEYRRPFDLAQGPLIRARLLRLSDDDHVLVLVMHHIVSDGWTGGIVFEELGGFYQTLSAQQSPSLPGLPIQYADYAMWQRESMQGALLDTELSYWRTQLAGAPALLDLPTDGERPKRSNYRGDKRSLLLPTNLSEGLKTFSAQQGVTLFTSLLAALKILLFHWTGQQDLVVGTVSANRNHVEVERLIGCFMNFLALRLQLTGRENAKEIVGKVNQTVLGAYAHQEFPFEKLIEALNPERALNVNPLYNVALLMQNFPEIAFRSSSLEARFVPLNTEVAFLDLRFVAAETTQGIHLECEYAVDLFDADTIDHLLNAYRAVLDQLVTEPQKSLADFSLPDALVAQSARSRKRSHKQTIVITATFTAEPLEEPLAFWMKEIEIPTTFRFAPYNQVFQQLLDPSSLLAQNTDGFNVVLLRMDDWQGFESASSDGYRKIENSVRELINAVRTAARRSATSCLLCLCPPSNSVLTDADSASFYRQMEALVVSELKAASGVHVITSTQVLDLYPVSNYEDPYANHVGHIPYTPAFFTALGTMIARRIQNIRSAPHKVIVLDCDQTLWKGVCGEDGPLAVEVDAPRRSLQEFMIAQRNAGMLLCLCSKNAEEDVTAVFDRNSGMVLRAEHIVAWRVNWRPKSENLKDLTRELQLGLDSFIFVDDNPLECAEVEAHCPDVLTLQLPKEPKEFEHFLRHVWAFDHRKLTEADTNRSSLYGHNIERERLRQESGSLEEFLAGLELDLQLRPMRDEDMARVSQLTGRTNQFNFSGIRRTENEIEKLCQAGAQCLVVNLRDRFGDYGLVGVLIFAEQSEAITVDTFLLSCRALGRRVEHSMLAKLGEIAQQRQLVRVDVHFTPTEKNQPAFDFLESVGARFKQTLNGGMVYRFPAAHAATAEKLRESADGVADRKPASAPVSTAGPGHFTRLAHIASDLSTVDAIMHAIESSKVVRARSNGTHVAPRNPAEEILAGIWARMLCIETVGIHDNFFALGGHSLLATQVIARIRQAFGVELPLRAMFETRTLSELAERIESEHRTDTDVEIPPLSPAKRPNNLPLSFAQQRLWFLDQLEPGNPLYNIPQMIRMHGTLDEDALQQGFNQIVQRHESLRTTFATTNNQPIQVIAPELNMLLPITDLEHLDNDLREAEVQRLAKKKRSDPLI